MPVYDWDKSTINGYWRGDLPKARVFHQRSQTWLADVRSLDTEAQTCVTLTRDGDGNLVTLRDGFVTKTFRGPMLVLWEGEPPEVPGLLPD